MARLKDAAGTIDILVNNAGISPDKSWETVSLESWRAVFDVNLLAPFRLCQVFAPAMRDRGWGRIINIASVYGSIAGKPYHYPPNWDPSSYFASKHAVHGLTRNLAVRLVPHRVCVNSLSPGGIAGATNRGLTADEQAEAAATTIPEQRVAEQNVRPVSSMTRSRWVGSATPTTTPGRQCSSLRLALPTSRART